MDRRTDRRTAGGSRQSWWPGRGQEWMLGVGLSSWQALRTFWGARGVQEGSAQAGAGSQHSQWWPGLPALPGRPQAEWGLRGGGSRTGRAGACSRHRARALELELGVPGRHGTESLPARGP